MASFLTMLQEFLTAVLAMMGTVITFIMANPIILVAVMLAVSGTVIGIVKRFLPRKG